MENKPLKYYYYLYHERYIAREEAGTDKCACDQFEFYLDGKWQNDERLSLSLSDAIRGVCGCSVFECEDLTEQEALRRIAEQDNK